MVEPGVRVRHYCPDDRARCLAIFDSNVPESFTTPERRLFEAFLDALPGPYFLVECEPGDLVACGGYAVVPEARRADLCWGMVARDHQGLGFGRFLSELRIQRIREDSSIAEVVLNTSQLTCSFYEKLGFVTECVTIDGFGPGLDRHDMRLRLRDL